MLDLIRRKSAAGQPPSPSEAASTTTRETSTPHGEEKPVAAQPAPSGPLTECDLLLTTMRQQQQGGLLWKHALSQPRPLFNVAPLSDAPADEHLRLVASGRASSIALARPGDASGKPEVAHHDYEGDNRSFYGSESQVWMVGGQAEMARDPRLQALVLATCSKEQGALLCQ